MNFIETTVFIFFIHKAVSLQCYQCPLMSSTSIYLANLKCLENSTEITCSFGEDRCYSTPTYGNFQIEKGCSTLSNCRRLDRICCPLDYCNGGYGLVQKKGLGKPCEDVNNCIQGHVEMDCLRLTATSSDKECVCVESAYPDGIICRRKEDVGGECTTDLHCLPNLFCESGVCRCRNNFYFNSTCILKLLLWSPCSEDIQCRPLNSECRDGRCLCRPNYYSDPHSDNCSGVISIQSQCRTFWLITIVTLSTLINRYSD